jgi:hypothetical protein
MIDIAGYLDSVGGRPSAGANWVLNCPFCGRSRHLYCTVEESEDWDGRKKPPGVWICFGCGERGRDFAYLLCELEGITLSEARATIARWKLGTVRLRPASTSVPKRELADEAAPWLPPEFESVADVWPKYLTTRGITREIALEFNLGVCRKHVKCDQCKRGGCPRNMAHRIILPIECPAGRSYQARAISDDMEPRYLSGDNSGQLLFGWHTVAESSLAVIVEGPFDTIKVRQAGLPSTALMGKEIRTTQIEMLRMQRREYIVALDPLTKDRYAIESACKIADLLSGRVVVGLESDPGASTEEQIWAAVEGAVEPLEARMIALEWWLKQLGERER